ncbi:ATP-dependent DNA helicase RECG, chloroplastic [Glycine max]|nr:ATP-dependent DNA helicase RECG, chloroplastic [Glycine max]
MQLANVVPFQGTFLNRRMRYCSFVPSKMCYRLKHKLAEKKVARGVGSGSKLRNKVVALMDYNLPDLIGNGSGEKKSKMSPKDALDDLDISLICKRFPSITLGYAPRVDLYDGTRSCSETMNSLATENFENSFSDSLEASWVQSTLSEERPSLYASHSSLTSSTLGEEDSCPSPLPPDLTPSIYEEKLDQITREDSQMKVRMESQSNSTPSELFLDKSVSCIPGLSKRHYQQLDNYGFHTLRKLLLHFPRSYANLQNAHAKIDDGQYLIFVGKVLSSRGVKANFSFSFLEVVVGCQVAESESAPEHVTIDVQKTVYLHLKKFFRGSRFTFKAFLKNLAEKYQEGDIVCVSGKVRTMRAKDHYEMREYNIDVLEDGKDLSFFAKERPYPIYPSKGRLNPIFLRDTIARALQALPVNVDPIPKDITEQFGLPSLHDAYFGIHKPKDINEADLARKRLIFDEFFYVQPMWDLDFFQYTPSRLTLLGLGAWITMLGRLFQMLESLGSQMEKDVLLDKYRRPVNNAVCTEQWSSLTKKVLDVLPYTLTTSQQLAVSEIIWDLQRPVPMNRLLQGDVGCGKTVVAFLACIEVIGSGYQAAFMVPTELLAIQHYEHLLKLLENLDEVVFKPTVALLTGSTPLKQSRMIRKGIQTGEISMVIGTHSLIADSVEFAALRITVVDEQHRFGVIQRGSDTTFSFSPELSLKKSILRSNHWSEDTTSGYGRQTTHQPRPMGNNLSDDTCREGTEDRVKSIQSPNTANVDSGSRSAEKAEANGCLKEAILNMDKAASREHKGDPVGNNLNCGDKAPYGESVGDIRHTHLHLSLPSLQTQKDVGPSYNLGPFRENEGKEAQIIKYDNGVDVMHEIQDKSPNQRHFDLERGLKSTIECNTTMLEEAQQQWNLGKVLGLEADTDQSDYIHSFANMEFRFGRGIKWASIRNLVGRLKVDLLCLQETKRESFDKASCQALLQIVEDMGYFSENGWEWTFSWRRNLFDNEMGIASIFIDQIEAISINVNLNDTWVWGAESNGIFSTKSAYNLIKAEQSSEVQCLGFHQLWDLKIPLKALSFAWRLLWDRLPTKDNLSRRQVEIDNDLCPFCQSQPETASHLFFTCGKVLPLWWEFNTWVKEDRLYCASSNSNMEDAITDDSSKSDAYMAPHVLAMSATPIPRTLALALYGDMTMTQITDLPPGRIPVQTFIIEGNDKGLEDVYKMMLGELEDGGKVYLVYPIIELSEQLPQLRAASADLEVISHQFRGYNCGLLHGKMTSEEKEETLRKFRTGEIHILLATQVIEIGVDVPDASMMVVLNSERFGIAQLHQLRGRVGRGTRASKCVLVASAASSLNRLKVLEQSSDGFYLANMDLLLRGPGDLLGKKQSGHLPEFPVARLEVDGNILQDARIAALTILSASHDLEQFPELKLELSIRQPLCLLGD